MKLSLFATRFLAIILLAWVSFIGYTKGLAPAVSAFMIAGLVIETVRPKRPGLEHCFMAYTGVGLSDIFIPSVYAAIQPVDSVATTAFAQSGVAVTNPLLQAAAMSGTMKIEVPLWNDLDQSVEENHSDASDTNASPLKVGVSHLDARNSYLNQVYGVADLASELAKATPGQGQPMTRIKNRFGAYWAQRFQKRLIAVSRGVLNSNVANNSSDMVSDISLQTTVGVTSANRVSSTAVIGAVFTMGDRFAEMRVIAMHSVVYQNLVGQQLITYVKDATNTLNYPTYLGLRVVVDDGLPVIAGTTSGFRYVSVIFGAGAIGYGEGRPLHPTEVYRLPLSGNGGGNEAIVERVTWMIHPGGWNWTDNTVADASPTIANLQLAANWTRVFPRKLCKMAFLITNG